MAANFSAMRRRIFSVEDMAAAKNGRWLTLTNRPIGAKGRCGFMLTVPASGSCWDATFAQQAHCDAVAQIAHQPKGDLSGIANLNCALECSKAFVALIASIKASMFEKSKAIVQR